MKDDDTDGAGSAPSRLPIGDYEVMVVDVEPCEDTAQDAVGDSCVELSVVILKGPLKGEVVELRHQADADDLLGFLGGHGRLSATREGLGLRLED